MPLIRVCAVNGTKVAPNGAMSRPRMPYCSFASTTMERPSGVSSDREDSCAASASSCSLTPDTGMNSAAWRLPSVIVPVLSSSSVSTSPAASTARPDLARTLNRISRSMPAMPMADSSAPMVVGMSVTNSATRMTTDTWPARISREERDRGGGEHEDDRQPDQQDVEGNLVRRLLPAGALHQGDHAVDEGRALGSGDPHRDHVRQHPGAAGHGRAVTAALADHRGGLAGDGGLVDRGDALDRPRRRWGSGRPPPPAPGRRPSGRRRDVVPDPVRAAQPLGRRLCARPAQGRGLRLAAALRHGLREVGEQHGDP